MIVVWIAISLLVSGYTVYVLFLIFELQNRVKDLEERLDNTFIKSPGPAPKAPGRQRTTQGEKGVARQAHVQVRGVRNNNNSR